MYASLDVTGLLDRAKQVVIQSRGVRLSIYVAAESFAVEHGLYLGGSAGVAGILGEQLDYQDYLWQFYTTHPYQMAKSFADTLYAAGTPGVVVKTHMRGRELSVTVDGAPYFKFYRLSLPCSAPRIIPGWHTGLDVQSLSLEFTIAAIYQSLYDPARCSDWVSLLEQEKKLFGMMPHDRISQAPSRANPDPLSAKISLAVGAILVSGSSNSTELISDAEPARIKKILSSLFGAEIAARSREAGIPGDFRLERAEYWPASGRQHKILVYNSTSYESIPAEIFSGDEAQPVIANGWVRLRFQAIYAKISQADRQTILDGTTESAFPRDFYFGRPEIMAVTRKKITADDHFTPDYFPGQKK